MHIESPQIEWRDGQPFSTQFGDIYASTRDALAETDFVFLEASGFKDAVPQQTTLSVAETGFGTGLNFLSSWAYWKQHQQGDGNLHFLSIERFPLSKEDLSRALQAWPEFKGLAEELIAVYPIRRAGFHRLVLDQGRVQLTLAFGDIQECLPEIDHQFDFWFLDGFSPSKNQDMWTEQVCKNIVRCSKVGTGLSTFTAAGAVRRALSASGFDVVKCQGFSGKREMLRATLSSPVPPTKKLPFYAIPNSETLPESVAIIGAGLAGCSMAYVCSKRGMRVSIFDPNGCAQAASGNPAGVAGPALSASTDAFAQYYFQAWQSLKQFALATPEHDHRSWFQLVESCHYLNDDRSLKRGKDLCRDHAQLDAWAELQEQKLLIKDVPLVNPGQLCQFYLQQSGLLVEKNEIDQLHYKNGQWSLSSAAGAIESSFDAVVIANAQSALHFEQSSWIETQEVRGQLAIYDSAINKSKQIQQAEYYLTPFWQGRQVLGATYHRDDSCSDVRQSDHELLEKEGSQLFEIDCTAQRMQGRVGFRCCGPDRMPVVGPLVDSEDFLQRYADLQHGRDCSQLEAPAYLPHCYISSGHGSRGISGSYLAAQLIADQMFGYPAPVSLSTWHAVAPQRFLLRRLRRGTAK